ncbi:MAG: hypothetical protein H0U27_03055 [Nitrosopumilus sp.]|nr:hypothetical protein [Nitrosopumilus sp.]
MVSDHIRVLIGDTVINVMNNEMPKTKNGLLTLVSIKLKELDVNQEIEDIMYLDPDFNGAEVRIADGNVHEFFMHKAKFSVKFKESK